MRKHDDEYKMGTVDADSNYDSDILKFPHFERTDVVDHRNGYRAGTLDRPERMEEGEDAGSIEDMTDEQDREKALQGFTNNIRQIISAKMMNKPIKIKLTGEDQLVKQIVNLIRKELNYLKALMSGQAADAPAPQKNKAIIDSEAKVLDRMLGVDGAWPFK